MFPKQIEAPRQVGTAVATLTSDFLKLWPVKELLEGKASGKQTPVSWCFPSIPRQPWQFRHRSDSRFAEMFEASPPRRCAIRHPFTLFGSTVIAWHLAAGTLCHPGALETLDWRLAWRGPGRMPCKGWKVGDRNVLLVQALLRTWWSQDPGPSNPWLVWMGVAFSNFIQILTRCVFLGPTWVMVDVA